MNKRSINDIDKAIFAVGVDIVITLLSIFVLDKLCERSILTELTNGNRQCFPAWSYVTIPTLWFTSFLVSSTYDPKRILKAVDELQSTFMSISLGFLSFCGLIFLFDWQMPRLIFLLFVFIDFLLLMSWRVFFRIYMRSKNKEENKRNILIVGVGNGAHTIMNAIEQKEDPNLKVVGFLADQNIDTDNFHPILGRIDDIRNVLQDYLVDDVIFALPLAQYERVVQLVKYIDDIPIRIGIIPDYFNLSYHRSKVVNFAGIPLIGLKDPSLNELQRLIKRFIDIFIVLFSLLLVCPLLLIIGLVIKIDSEGPVIFKQNRIGENGRMFQMYKFRSMTHYLTKSKRFKTRFIREKVPNDPRITRFGRFLRRTSLDELPQFLNILRGDMSIVGPRPELPQRVAMYEPWQRVRFSVPQGLTGWWQINGRATKPLHLNTQYDLYYVENYSLWLDLKILLKTPFIVIQGKGAF